MTFWRRILDTIARNPISFFAVLCVAATASFLGYMTHRMVDVLESPNWCARAVQAERISGEGFTGLTACVELLTIQLQAVSTGFHISIGSYSLALLVLVVVVVAGAKASLALSKDSISADISRQDPVAAAEHVVEGAEQAADEVRGAP
jgi:hypothetical protein